MQTVVETPAYLRQAKIVGMTDDEMKTAIDLVAANPEAGDRIVGSGGCRKVRLAGKGKGKSGGYRIITWHGGDAIPVFLLWVLSKGSAANLTDAQVIALSTATRALKAGADAARTRGKP